MAEVTNTTAEKAPKKSWFKGVRSEFKKIVFPDREHLIKQSIAVISVTIALGLLIYVLDFAVEKVVSLLIG